jgi:hypothetical protein
MDYSDDASDEGQADKTPMHHSHVAGPLVSRDGCTVGRFNAWVVHDSNRLRAAELREQDAARQKETLCLATNAAEQRRRRTTEMRLQRLAAEQAVRGVREQRASSASSHRASREQEKCALRQRRQEFVDAQRKGAIQRHGEEQRKKTLQSKREAFEKRERDLSLRGCVAARLRGCVAAWLARLHGCVPYAFAWLRGLVRCMDAWLSVCEAVTCTCSVRVRPHETRPPRDHVVLS